MVMSYTRDLLKIGAKSSPAANVARCLQMKEEDMRFVLLLICMLAGFALMCVYAPFSLMIMTWCIYMDYDHNQLEDWKFVWYPMQRIDGLFR